MKRFLAATCFLTGLCAGVFFTSTSALASYEVTLPSGYEEGERNYPVLYFLGEEEGALTGLSQALSSPSAMDMILVQVSPEEDALAELSGIVEEVDASYRTVASSSARAVAGCGEEGYLALEAAYSDGQGGCVSSPSLFGRVGAISPDVQGERYGQYGDFLSLLQNGPFSNSVATQFYTFIRTPSEAETSYEEGGANDVIAYLIQKGAAYGGTYEAYYGNADETVLSLTIPNGEDGEEFRREAASQMAEGFSRRILRDLVSGSALVSPQVAKEEVSEVEVGFSLHLSEGYADYAEEEEAAFTFSLVSEDGMEPLCDFVSASFSVQSGDCIKESVVSLPNLVKGEKSYVRVSANLLGMEVALADAPLIRVLEGGEEPEGQFVDLMGYWRFMASLGVNGELPSKEEMEGWEEVIPCLGWWQESFSKNTNMKAFSGYAWYAKSFTLPESYEKGTYLLSLGGFDETDMVWVNGNLVGYTGLNPDTWQHEEDKWDAQRIYEVEAENLVFGGENEVLILTHNQSGDGGWYGGHPCLYSKAAYEARTAGAEDEGSRFVAETIPSAYKAIAMASSEETEEEEFLVYLPKGYDEEENAEKRYPVVYLFHQLNSSSRSYVVDHIDQLLDQGILEGTIPEVIVVIPDSAPESWWMGGWDLMTVKEILPYVEEKYRTYGDREHRFTAGASMGGEGSYYIGLSNPDIFGGMISFFGAINMGANPLSIAERMEEEVLSSYKYYFVCGNRDLYKFGIPAMQLDRLLRSKGIDHFFELGEGEHDSIFYLPYFVDAFGYMLGE